ncbi:MAG: M48 family metallopeptidase [bacterium]
MTIWSHETPVPGVFNDGAFPVDRKVHVRQSMGELTIEDAEGGEVLACWPLGALQTIPDSDYPAVLRLRQSEGEGGRLAILDKAFNENLTEWWPNLHRRLVFDRTTRHIAGGVALASVLGLGLFFFVLVPLLGRLTAHLIPPAFEERAAAVFLRHGDPVLERIDAARVCEIGNAGPVLDKLVEPLRKASGWPGTIRVRVIDDPLPNAAAIPGGEIVLFRGMLQFARDGDELAGILAHEIGHITRRHGVRNLFVTSLNFFGFDQLFGDFSGQLVVHPVSGAVLGLREARHAEREADRTAIEILSGAGLNVRPFADILDRIAYLQGDGEVARGWLATHPLSRPRSRTIRDAAPAEAREPALTAEEFGRLRALCNARTPEPQPQGKEEPSGTGAAGSGAPEARDEVEEKEEPFKDAEEEKPDLDDWDTGD